MKAELEDFGDDLSTWVATTMPAECFFDTDMDAVTEAYGDAIAWVMAQTQFTDAAKAEFAAAEIADAWVIAFAKAMDATVVTHEKSNPAIRRKVPIPNVCDALNVPYVDTFEMLRGLSTQFSWQAP